MDWATILGQPLAVRLLHGQAVSRSPAHAYLFVGPEGVGKRTLALQFARTLHCRAPLPSGDPCGSCPGCAKLLEEPTTHPDTHTVAPDGRFIKTEQVKQLHAQMYARPTESGFRIAIIDGADQLNAEAGNRLLKILEEPPEYALFFLLTSNLAGVLPTIISRCQIINFAPIPPEEVARALERRGFPAEPARLFASLSGGSLGVALGFAQDETVVATRDEALALIHRLVQMDDFDLLAYAESLEKGSLDRLLDMLVVWLRDAIVFLTSGNQLVLNADRRADVESIANTLGSPRLMRMLATVMETRGRLQRNANSRLAIDVLLLQLAATV